MTPENYKGAYQNKSFRGAPGVPKPRGYETKRDKSDYDSDGDPVLYYDSAEYKNFCELVYSVIGEDEISIREIKLRLGENLVDNWLMDALDVLEEKLEIKHSVPTKYKRKNITEEK